MQRPLHWGGILIVCLGSAFNDKSRKIKMSLLVTKVSQEEKAATRQTVDEDRKHAVEAARVLFKMGWGSIAIAWWYVLLGFVFMGCFQCHVSMAMSQWYVAGSGT